MAGRGPAVGFFNKLYYNSAAMGATFYSSPTWVEATTIGDVSIDGLDRDIVELKRRATQFKVGLPALMGLITVSVQMPHTTATGVPGGSVFQKLLMDNLLAATIMDIMISDQAIATSGAFGLRLPVLVTSVPWQQPLEDVGTHDVKFTVAYNNYADSGLVNEAFPVFAITA